MMGETSLTLLEQLAGPSDEGAWERFVTLYQPLIHGWVRRLGVPAPHAADVVQDVFTIVVAELPRFAHNGQPGAFRTWLRTIAVNRLRVFWRQARSPADGEAFLRRVEELEDPHSDLSRLWDQEHDHFVLSRLLQLVEAEVAPATFEAFRRLTFEEASAATVAADLGMSVGAIYVAKSRVLQRLRRAARQFVE
jgi:RNA polymerase sigma-70 factor (ECF subfamily)